MRWTWAIMVALSLSGCLGGGADQDPVPTTAAAPQGHPLLAGWTTTVASVEPDAFARLVELTAVVGADDQVKVEIGGAAVFRFALSSPTRVVFATVQPSDRPFAAALYDENETLGAAPACGTLDGMGIRHVMRGQPAYEFVGDLEPGLYRILAAGEGTTLTLGLGDRDGNEVTLTGVPLNGTLVAVGPATWSDTSPAAASNTFELAVPVAQPSLLFGYVAAKPALGGGASRIYGEFAQADALCGDYERSLPGPGVATPTVQVLTANQWYGAAYTSTPDLHTWRGGYEWTAGVDFQYAAHAYALPIPPF